LSLVDAILDDVAPLYPYAPGSWGPEDAEALIARDGRNWVTLPHQE